jgi:hypothetical protein
VGNNSVVLIPEAQHIIVEQAVERDSDSEVAKQTKKRRSNNDGGRKMDNIDLT